MGVEEFVNSNDYIALSIDFANKDKHITLSSKRSAKNIWKMNVWIHINDPNGNDRSEVLIEVDWQKLNWLELCSNVINSWKTFLTDNKLIESNNETP